jgi:hypothetical protein
MAAVRFDIIDQQVDQAFRRARSRAWWNTLRRWMRHRPVTLLQFKEVRARLQVQGQRDLGLQTVPLDQIVGSEGRSSDFDRDFLPRNDKLRERWLRIGRARYREEHLPPVQLIKVGDIYFVRDGNHRLSVAHQLGQYEIDAYVVEVETNVPLTPDLDAEELDHKAAQSHFMAVTNLPHLRPSFTIPVQASDPATYDELIRHIEAHRSYMASNLGQDVSWDEAVGNYFDTIYQPQVEAMRRLHASIAFPRRTETNLYLSIINHRCHLAEQHGHAPGPEEAVIDFMARYGTWTARHHFRRLWRAGSGLRHRFQHRWELARQGWRRLVSSGHS